MRRKAALALFAFAVAMACFAMLARAVDAAGVAQVKTVNVGARTIAHKVQAQGVVAFRGETAVLTEAGQVVSALFAREGDTVQARVTKVREDGKLDLSPRDKAYLQIDADSELVMETIKSYDGVLPFTDKASPAMIDKELGLSKNAFKRAVGRLLKQNKIEITGGTIRAK